MAVKKRTIVVFTGAGISAESGISTFRDNGGLWDKYDVREVATPEAWNRNRELVLRFYNERRKNVLDAQPNEGHKALVQLEKKFDVQIITQNIDDLHERAGSKNILHLHGEILKARSTKNPQLIYPVKGWELKEGDKCELGSQLRPHIVWFGEMVPNMDAAYEIAAQADVFIIIGTSLNVYPAANLLHYTPPRCPMFLIDPNDVNAQAGSNIIHIRNTAAKGMPILAEQLLSGKI
ncbi:MAG: NAD-dependent deacylase [Bacteroidetes bacterium]|nr:NAD-dependent deacylase [Bacteroidota bacterium]